MESRDEACELQQLVSSDVEGDGDDIAQDSYTASRDEKIVSPVRSNKISSSGDTSQSSISRSVGRGFLGLGSTTHGSGSARVTYINEKRLGRDHSKPTTARPRNVHKAERKVQHHCFLSEVPDVRHMERALIGLLDDFHSGKLRAFGKGCSMEQMTDIREQQERLARLHFDLGATISTTDPPLSTEGLRHSHTTMAQLVQRLEQLSVSIEKLHSSDK
ncbi:uncharacterized protein CBL_02733 [Carabus blaptoides fortunei]